MEYQQNPDTRLSAADAARAVSVSRQLLNHWRRTGKIARGKDGKYRLGDVKDYERESRNSTLSNRNWRRGLPADEVARLSVA